MGRNSILTIKWVAILLVLLFNWLKEVHHSPHLLALMKGKNVNIYLESDGIFYITIQHGTMAIKEELNEEIDVYIYCNENGIDRLLNGEVRLRQAIAEKLVVVKGSLRNILLLESLFWLSSVSLRS